MTLSKTALFLAASLGLAAFGCRQPRTSEGTIEFVVRSIEEVGGSVPRGSFEVRGIDNDEHARVGIGSSAARTLRVRLPAGAYSVAWRPSAAASSTREPSASEWPQIVVVSPESSATVDVFVASQSTRGAMAIAHTTAL